MRIGNVVYVSRSIGEVVVPPSEHFESLAKGLKDDAKEASRIVIVSAYFGEEYILELLASPSKQRRARCVVQIVLGYDNTTELVFWQVRIDKLRHAIIKLGYTKKRVIVRLFRDEVPLHTKIYGFLRTTAPVWYVGSANASAAIKGDRHELMVRTSGRSAALEKYVRALLDHKSSGGAASSGSLGGLQGFFNRGFLLFKPTRPHGFTYEAFTISPSERRKISNQLGQNSGVPHSDPAAEGFGFNLLSALGVESEVKKSKAPKLLHRKYCVETVYGYWVPEMYGQKIREALEVSKKDETTKLKQISKVLASSADSALVGEFQRYLKISDEFFKRIKVKAIPTKDAIANFNAFLSVRRTWLSDASWISRNATKIILERMPNIWSDQGASDRFMSTFFEDVEAVLNAPGRTPLIYSAIRNSLKLPSGSTAVAIREKLESRIKSGKSSEIFHQ